MRLYLAAVSVLALMLSACIVVRRSSVVFDMGLTALAPADTTFVLGADLDAIRNTHVFQKYVDQVSLPQMDEFAKKTGIDPRRDLHKILSCSNGKTAIFLARGNFASGKSVQIEGLSRTEYKGHTLFGNEQSGVLFWNSSTAVGGRTEELRALADSGGNGRGLPSALLQKAASVGPNAQVWGAFNGGLQNVNLGLPEQSNAGQVLRILRGIDNGTLGIDLRDGFGLEIHVECQTANDAKHVHDAVRGVIGLGRLSTPDNQPEMLKLYDAINIQQDQTKVDVTARIAPELEDKFLDLWLKKR